MVLVFFRKKSFAKNHRLYSKKCFRNVRLKIYKGNVTIVGRKSENSLYNLSLVSFDERGGYNQKDAEGIYQNFFFETQK